jgi:cytochrome b561
VASVRNTATRYGVVAQLLHWLILLLVMSQIYLAVAAFRSTDPVREAELLDIHRPLGLTILILMLARLVWRVLNLQPKPADNLSGLQRGLARATHWTLYGLLLLIPLTGWLKAGAESISVSYFGLFTVPGLTGPDEALRQSLRVVHLYLNTALLLLVPIHVLAALWHHFWRRDDTLRRMFPYAGASP